MGYTNGRKIDVCQEHKSFGNGKTKEQFYKELFDVQSKYYGPVPMAKSINES